VMFYWMGALTAFGVPVAAALLSVRRPRLASRLLAAWVALLGVLVLVTVGTTMAAFDDLPTGDRIRGGVAAALVLGGFTTLTVGLWRERRWAVVTLCALFVVAAGLNAVVALRDGMKIEPTTLVSYGTILPALLFLTYRAISLRPASHR
jgi:hypothetical protein